MTGASEYARSESPAFALLGFRSSLLPLSGGLIKTLLLQLASIIGELVKLSFKGRNILGALRHPRWLRRGGVCRLCHIIDGRFFLLANNQQADDGESNEKSDKTHVHTLFIILLAAIFVRQRPARKLGGR